MAQLQTNILGKVLFFYELPQIEISHYENAPLRVVLSTDDRGRILDESYWADFNQRIYIDIKDLVASELSLDIPEPGEDLMQSSIYKVFHISIGDDEISGSFTVNGFSSEVQNKISDIDTLRVPEDYRLPLSLFNNADSYSLEYLFNDGTSTDGDEIVTHPSGVGTISRMIFLPDSPAARKNKFRIKITSADNVLLSPVYEISREHMEQYLFVNRYGGFENIPMAGTLEFAPNLSFESGSYSNMNEPVAAESEYVYSQNSGYLSERVIELMSELLCSSQIYHLDKNGDFRAIVILESSLNSKSTDNLHSFSFMFKYAEDIRPVTLKGKIAQEHGRKSSESVQTLMFRLDQSPMSIRHNKDRFPCVTVMDDKNHIVTTSVEYIDSNSIKVSWNGNLAGYIYVN